MKNSKDIVEAGLERYSQNMVGTIILPQQGNETATKDAIRHFTNGLGDPNPLWRNEDYARNSINGSIIAPPSFLNAISEGQAIVGLPGLIATFVGSGWEWFKLIKVNDRFSVTNQLFDLKELKGSGGGRRFLQSGILNYSNQRGELVGRCKWNIMRTEAKLGLGHQDEQGKRPGKIEIHRYSEEEIAAIYAAIDDEEIRGWNPRYFEDVNLGDELKPVVKGPLSLSDMVAWAIGTGWHRIELAHGLKLSYLRANPGLSYIDPDTGLPEPIANSHFLPSAARILMGSPLPLDLGFQRVAWLGHTVTNWMSDYGFLEKLEARLKSFVRFGDTTWCKGRVIRKYVEGKEHLAECEIWSENQRGEITTTGNAVVVLPSKELQRPKREID
jgi:acyl dehydratase